MGICYWLLQIDPGASPESHIPVIHPVTPQACGIRRHNSVALPLLLTGVARRVRPTLKIDSLIESGFAAIDQEVPLSSQFHQIVE